MNEVLDLFLGLLELLPSLAGRIVARVKGVQMELEGSDMLEIVANRFSQVDDFEVN